MALTKISGSVIKDSVSLSGNVSVGGTLTYEDVTNVDAVGVITARSGVNVSGGQLDVGSNIKLGNAGVITATSYRGDGSQLTGTGASTGEKFVILRDSSNPPALSDTGRNIIIGHNAAHKYGNGSASGGNENVFLGYVAGYTQTSGDGNVFLGAGAGYSNATSTGNVYVGQESGRFATGANNVCLGRFAGNVGGFSGSNNIVIGYNSDPSAANISNEITLGDANITKFRVPGINVILKDNGGTPTQGHVLTVDGNGEAGFAAASGTTINNNANDRIITGSGTANTLEGESTFTFDGTKVRLNAGSTSHIQIDGTSSYLQVAGIKVWVGAGNRAHNTAVGNGALNAANGGDDCTAIGHNAYANGTSGEDNTVVGSHAMDDNVTGHRNCAFGHASLSALTSGYNNSCYGRTSGFYLLNGHNNTFLGYDAGFSATNGSYNIYAGSGAGMYETTSSDNVAIGYKCFGAERSGGNSNQFNKNTVVGHQALAQQRISNGDGENVCLGYRAMYNTQTSAWRNVVIGFEAGYNNQASKTTFVGTYAGKGYQSGGNTMCLGYNAGTASSPSGNLTNQQDTVVLGDNNISQFYCSDTSISSSDARDKTDITEWTHGLSFINQLKPVTYRWDKRTWYGTDEEPIGTPDGSKKKARLHLGFLAQDALEVEKSFGYASKKDDMLAVNLNEDESAYGMKYERLVVPLTKAVQELSAEVDKLKNEIAVLKSS